MKHLFPVLLFLTSAATAQKRTTYGLETGAGPSRLVGNPILRSLHDARIGYYAGVVAERHLGVPFLFRASLGYEVTGSRVKSGLVLTDPDGNSLGNAQGDLLNDFRYITGAIQGGAAFRTGKWRFFAAAGPFVGMLLRSATYAKIDGIRQPASSIGRFQDVNLGLANSLGASRSLGARASLQLSVRQQLGLSNISRTPVSGGSIRTHALYALAGVNWKW